MKLLQCLCFLSIAALPLTAASQPSDDPYGAPDPAIDLPLEGEALTEIFIDRTHRGYYEVGDWDDADPAFSEVMNADGTTLHVRDGISSAGRWQTRSNVVCFTYDDLSGGCFNIYQRGNCYYALSAYDKALVAITVMDGDTPDCEPSYA
ncbi:MAG: hypothetical protein WBF53_15020 [Litorimonas sp.]